jgi:hypothetical protein
MKIIILMAAALLIASCGKNNSSGKPEAQSSLSSPLMSEATVRQEFFNQGIEVLKNYQDKIRRELGENTLVRMRMALKENSNISFSVTPLQNTRNSYVRSQRTRDGRTVLYIGEEHPDLSWRHTLYRRDIQLDRSILHELLMMAGVDDTNLRYTYRII